MNPSASETHDSHFVSALSCPDCHQSCQVEEYKPEFFQLKHLFQTNNPLSPLEQSSALNLVESIENDVSQIDKDIENTLEALKARKDRIEAHLESARSLLAPIRKVPRDVIGEILLHAIGVYNLKRDVVSLDTTVEPWTYTQVCRLWRQEILSRPSIWMRVRITAGVGSDNPDVLADLLSRSGAHDLTLTLELPHPKGPNVDKLIDTAIAHSHRWKTVSLLLSKSSLGRLGKVEHHIPRLTNLRIKLANRFWPKPAAVLISVFEDAPALRGVSFHNFAGLDLIKLPWGQITHFSDSSVNYHDTHTTTLVNKMDNLEFYDPSGILTPPTSESMTLSCLRSLSLRDPSTLNNIDAQFPSLSTIHFYDLFSVADFEYLIARSRCTITKLGVHFAWRDWNGHQYEEHVTELWKALPTVETVEFRTKPPSKVLAALLDDDSLLPKLKTLQFDASFLTPSDWSLVRLVDELLSTRESVTHLCFLNGDETSQSAAQVLVEIHGLFQTVEVVTTTDHDPDDIWQDGNSLWVQDESSSEEDGEEDDSDDELDWY